MSELLIDARSLTKAFAGVQALRNASFDLRPGEVHALVGENGAGKSTLIRIITGAVTPDSGELVVGGTVIAEFTPSLATSLEIAAVYQQPALFPDMSVAENIAFGREEGGIWSRVNWRQRRSRAIELLARAGSTISPDRLASTLSMPEQQMVEIARALGAEARILILDEPTASLTDREVASLFAVVGKLRESGAGVIYISHRLDEVAAIADRITVLRDGLTIGTAMRGEVDRAALIRMMVGREFSAVFPKRAVPIGRTALELRDVSSHSAGVRRVSLSVRSGEILGIAGLVGSGRTELAETIFGLTPPDSGEIMLDGVPVKVSQPSDAVHHRIAYVPEDRRQHGVILDMPIAANISLASLPAVSRSGLLVRREEAGLAQGFLERLRIKAPGIESSAGSLSGGNQQKVALARWLAIDPAVLILDEPTQGVDVGSKSEIHSQMVELAERGLAIIMISSEMPELLGMSDRIAVMHNGTISGFLSREEATPQRILTLALGHPAAPELAPF